MKKIVKWIILITLYIAANAFFAYMLIFENYTW